MLRKFWFGIKQFFLPPPGTPVWLRLLPFVILGILTFSFLTAGTYAWEYTNSTVFCGTTCHTMPPQYSAYQHSPHARVQCVECHIGRDVITTQFSRKAGDLRHVFLMLTEKYEYPIHTTNMRPARESCERCHFPEKFSDDSLREVHHFNDDELNTAQSIFLVLKTGGGSKREGLGRGIHWHIENEIYYYSTDDLDQNIPYVRVVDENGVAAEYYDLASGLTPTDIAGKTLKQMDCITCHNRITHTIPSPEEAVEQALSQAIIPADLPFVREKAVALLTVEYPDQQTGLDEITAFETYYQENYPEVYNQRTEEIQSVVIILQEIYQQIVFQDQKIDWETHPDNLGHKLDPGCFRCHDGKHLTQSEEAIRLECNLCHSIPVTSSPTELTTQIELVSGPEPASHTHTSWIALHGKAFDSTCLACHSTDDPSTFLEQMQAEGKPPSDGSFCGNEACHNNVWTYAGLADTALAPILERQLYILQNTSPYILPGVPATYERGFKALFEGRCTACHSGPDAKGGLDLTTYANALQGGNTGPGLVPNSPEDSQIFIRQTTKPAHFGQMIRDELDALEQWLLAGAPEN
ncbi:MAG: NapC/NirT family cytochrome c [Anaerolineales bacterium]|nr:NapC/NirT family cytochrome c [Anaerolineales bacterium]